MAPRASSPSTGSTRRLRRGPIAAPVVRPGRGRRAGVAAAALVVTVLSVAWAAPAAADGPVRAFSAVAAGAGVSVSGTYTPLVGNFVGDDNDDIFWYAPGSTPDYLWEGTSTRGAFVKTAKPVSGTYTPLVGDFRGDGHDDILWYAPGVATDSIWTAVGGTSVFQSSTLKIAGRYRPLALDQKVDVARFALGITSSPAKDHIVWYAPGSERDWVWRFMTDGTHLSQEISIAGSPQLFAVNPDRDDTEELFAYQPGPGVDALWRAPAGDYVASAPPSLQVNGTYTPFPAGPGYGDEVLWLGAGTRTDSRWSNAGPGGWASASVVPLAQSGPLLPLSIAPGAGYLYAADGPDAYYQQGTVSPVDSVDQGPGARPFSGDFDGDHSLDVFFYRPGSGTDAVGYGGFLA
jgi:hypothetical protein